MATLPVKPGHWRVDNTSLAVGRCYTEGVCLGAIASNTSSVSGRRLSETPTLQSSDTYGDALCQTGHSGPYCEVCLPNYYKEADQLCYDCDAARGNVNTNIGITVALVVGMLSVILISLCRGRDTAIAEILASDLGDMTEDGIKAKAEEMATGGGVRQMSWQARIGIKLVGARVRLKIFLSLIQVMSAIGTVFEIRFPPVFSNVMKWIGVLQLDVFATLPLDCVTTSSFHVVFLLKTLVPLGIMLILGVLGALLIRGGDKETKKGASRIVLGNILLNLLFFILFLIYPSVSKSAFSAFQCKDVGDGTHYLRADLSIDCASPSHIYMMVYAGIMLAIYPFGVPLIYAYLLFFQHGKQLFRLRTIEILAVKLAEGGEANDGYDRLAGKASIHHREDAQPLIDKLEAEKQALRNNLPGYIQTLSGSGAS